MVELARRSFITGLIALVAAPAIVRAGSLMPIKVDRWAVMTNAQLMALLSARIDAAHEILQQNLLQNVYGDLAPTGALAGTIPNRDARLIGDRAGPKYEFKSLNVAIALHG